MAGQNYSLDDLRSRSIEFFAANAKEGMIRGVKQAEKPGVKVTSLGESIRVEGDMGDFDPLAEAGVFVEAGIYDVFFPDRNGSTPVIYQRLYGEADILVNRPVPTEKHGHVANTLMRHLVEAPNGTNGHTR